MDRNYEPLRIVLASKNAKNLLEYLLSESVKDKYIQEFALRKDTFMLEVSKMSGLNSFIWRWTVHIPFQPRSVVLQHDYFCYLFKKKTSVKKK